MKKIYTVLLTATALFNSAASYAETHIVTQSALTFSPAVLLVEIGDIIEWQWTGGTHTTTSLIIPAGADVWDAPLTMGSPTFSYTVEVLGNYSYKCTPHFEMGMGGGFQAVAVSVNPVGYAPAEFNAGMDQHHTLHVNISNFNHALTSLKMIDLSGKLVATLLNEELAAGEHQLHFDLSSQPIGIYFVRMEQSGKVVTRKVLVN
ncbi:MAG: T9SS type A sorting domain-containing protein [Flavobacteriales bacterium]|nr:T9SS type A sorting domain-containing protein [Flavobacteriales bacterium]